MLAHKCRMAYTLRNRLTDRLVGLLESLRVLLCSEVTVSLLGPDRIWESIGQWLIRSDKTNLLARLTKCWDTNTTILDAGEGNYSRGWFRSLPFACCIPGGASRAESWVRPYRISRVLPEIREVVECKRGVEYPAVGCFELHLQRCGLTLTDLIPQTYSGVVDVNVLICAVWNHALANRVILCQYGEGVANVVVKFSSTVVPSCATATWGLHWSVARTATNHHVPHSSVRVHHFHEQ